MRCGLLTAKHFIVKTSATLTQKQPKFSHEVLKTIIQSVFFSKSSFAYCKKRTWNATRFYSEKVKNACEKYLETSKYGDSFKEQENFLGKAMVSKEV